MKTLAQLRNRQIHLDFHTGPAIGDVGTEFDAREFAATMKRAHVDSVTVFAKCHHGHLYYETNRPERHPGLKKGMNLLEEQVEALHREGIRAPIYVSVLCDEYAANTNPHWIAQNPDGTPQRRPAGMFGTGWQIMDMSSPYQDFLAEQTSEVLTKFKPVDGIFFDMCWDQPSISSFTIDAMRKAKLNPELEADRSAFARTVSHSYMKRFFDLVKSASKDATVFFNARPLGDFGTDSAFMTQAEIEALPSGGWGYLYFPRHVRFIRTVGQPYLGMTARFHKSWADFGGLKPYAALEYETSQMMAHGASCSIGDQMHPRGILDGACYDLVEKVYARVEAREPWLNGAISVAQIGVLQTSAKELRPEEGVTQLLGQLKHQFNFISHDADFSTYEMLILPDATTLSPAIIKRIRAYLVKGGALLASGTSGLDTTGTEVLLPELGIKAEGPSPFTATYIRFGKEIGNNVPNTDHVIYDRTVRVKPAKGATKLAGVVEPYFERRWDHFCSHFQTPGDKLSAYAGAVQNGNVGYIPFPVFSSYANHGNLPCRWLVENLMDRLMPDRLLRVNAPSTTEATITRQGTRTIVHLLQYCPIRRTPKLDIVEDIVPIFDVEISLRMGKKPGRVYLAPSGESLNFEQKENRTRVVVPKVEGHAMVVFE